MTIERHKKATELQERIRRIDGILELCNTILSKNEDGLCAILQTYGFDLYNQEVSLVLSEIEIIAEAFKTERIKLGIEFAEL